MADSLTVHLVIDAMIHGDLPVADHYFRSICSSDDRGGDDRDRARPLGWLVLWVLDQQYPARLSKVEILRQVENEIQRQSPVQSGWEKWFYCELVDQIDLLDRVYYVIAADEPQGYQMRVPIFRAWFHARARDRYPEMVNRLRDDLICASTSSDTGNAVSRITES